MAHNLATIDGQDAIAYLDQTPWHGLGKKLTGLQDIPPAERVKYAMRQAKLDFAVGSQAVFLADGTRIEGFKASLRFNTDGTVAAQLGMVGEGYEHVQNFVAAELCEVLAREWGCVPAALGALGNGERCWLLMRLADAKISPLDGDDVNGYFLLTWGHDGNVAILGLGTGIRVVCQNTLSLAMSGRKAWISIRHTASAAARLDEAAKLMATLMQALQATGDTFATMARKNLSAAQVSAYIAQAIPNTTAGPAVSPVIVARRDTVARLVFYGRGAALANQGADVASGQATVWAAYNAVTEYVDHVRTAEAQSPEGLRRAQESAIFGGNAEIKAQAFTLARQLVAA